ncbi:hypothetical protein Pla123a_14740 [Posidoniimonas polymericola]|uniref:Uncharacterized protein n=1 Tax=Posidoniimonas polymericola TaxID=2528002 RepID=A0A5C5YS23_9BACT|nr:hypothetical protein [Posidoniimonas polymericola]TWT77678.1 hypothetical protein Pla123a_14740 [Posidoniimonas polymericola]
MSDKEARSTIRTQLAIVLLAIGIPLAGAGVWALVMLSTWRHVPEAYAAWDAGTLLVAYMQANDDRWPAGWGELAAFAAEQGAAIQLRGGQYPPSDRYEARLAEIKNLVKIDWDFDPTAPAAGIPVTNAEGGPPLALWEDPNEMVREYLASRVELADEGE